MALKGFDPKWKDFPDYIIGVTKEIWEERGIAKLNHYYAPDIVVRSPASVVVGNQGVIAATMATLAEFPDRELPGEDVIWSHDGEQGLYSSHRIVSRSTHMGDDLLLGGATMVANGVMTIADCLCRENRIVEEWLVRENLRGVLQVGGDPWAVAQAQAEADREGDAARHLWRIDLIAATREGSNVSVPADHPAAGPAAMLAAAFRDDMFGEAAIALSPTCELRWPSNRHGWGRGYWIGCCTQIRGVLHKASFRLEHVAARPLPGGDVAVALRWALAGTHAGDGLWGKATGRDVLVAAVSHYRLRGGIIMEDTTVFDELAVLRQVCGGLGA